MQEEQKRLQKDNRRLSDEPADYSDDSFEKFDSTAKVPKLNEEEDSYEDDDEEVVVHEDHEDDDAF